MERKIRFRSDAITGLLKNEGDPVGTLFRSLDVETPITLCQGYGVVATTPLRVLAYAVPVLRLAKQLPSHTVIQFYWATEGVLRANHVSDPAMIVQSSVQSRELLAAYVRQFHPDMRTQVMILDDVPLNDEAERAITALMPDAEAIMAETPAIASFVRNRGGTSALRYMVEHSLYMRDPLTVDGKPLPLIVDGMNYPPDGGQLIMIGGPSEKIFYRLRSMLLRRRGAVHGGWNSHQLFTSVGDPPTYHPQEYEPYRDIACGAGNLELPDLLASALRAGSGVHRDFLVLLQDAARVERFSITPSTASGSAEQRTLEVGLDALHQLLRSI